MDSIKKILKVGYGPSRSHTMGPQKVVEEFKNKYISASKYKITIYGDLASFGQKYLTDYIIEKTLKPKEFELIYDKNKADSDDVNKIELKAINDDGNIIANETIYITLEGNVKKEAIEADETIGIYKLKTMKEILDWCHEEDLNLVDYALLHEKDIVEYTYKIMKIMRESLNEGLSRDDVIPGELKIKKRAKNFYSKYLENKKLFTIIYAYTLAVAEQSASGGKIVTAPTCGSCGVLPGVVFALQDYYNFTEEKIVEGLIVAGIIGNVIKTNSSIPGKSIGCQGEIGAASAMAAAAISQIKGATMEQIEYAAEISLEHHLGMTCDTMDGYIQVPCIERSAMAAQRALDAANYSMLTDGRHYITLDQVIETLKETGKDMIEKDNLKESKLKYKFLC